jgi:glycerate kinase
MAGMNILVAPDKFKGTLTAPQVCDSIEQGLLRCGVKGTIRKFPLADGGEGTLEVFLQHKQGRLIAVEAHDPLMRKIRASYALSDDGKTAFIEMARASGLGLLLPEERNPLRTTTFGTGQMMQDALAKGATHIILGVGGSATNDAALGALAALGATITDESGALVFPVGENLERIASIETGAALNLFRHKKLTAICDVTNLFYGEQGAAQVYAPQKGADARAVERLDNGMHRVAELVRRKSGIDLQQLAGSGAGGGFAGGMHAFLGAQLKPGAEVVFELSRFREAVAWADLIITGEGKLDEQTLSGKLVQRVVEQAHISRKPVWIVCGVNALTPMKLKQLNPTEVISLSALAGSEHALRQAASVLESLIYSFCRLKI